MVLFSLDCPQQQICTDHNKFSEQNVFWEGPHFYTQLSGSLLAIRRSLMARPFSSRSVVVFFCNVAELPLPRRRSFGLASRGNVPTIATGLLYWWY